MDIALLIGLILLNGFFAMSEIALISSKRARLERLSAEGDRGASRALQLGADPTRFLSTLQIGITAVGILNGIVGEAVFAEPLSGLFQTFGLEASLSSVLATAVVVVGITYLTIVAGELVPKRIAQANAEGIARRIAGPINLIAAISRPFVFVLSKSTDTVLRLIGVRSDSVANLTEEDIHAMLVEGSQAGVIDEQEHEIVRNAFRLDERQIVSLMTPRSEIVGLDLSQPVSATMERILGSEHSRFPVYRTGLHETLGVLPAKRLLRFQSSEGFGQLTEEWIRESLQPAVFVPETLTGMKLLEEFRQSGVQMVFVVDEYGEVLGLITLQDILEAITGEFQPGDAEDLWAMQREDGTWLLDGLIPIPELKDRLGLKAVPEERRGRFHTLAGMIMWLTGEVPRQGDVVDWEGWRLEVVDLDGNRIDKVLAAKGGHGQGGAEDGGEQNVGSADLGAGSDTSTGAGNGGGSKGG